MQRFASFIIDRWYLFLALIVILVLLFVNLSKGRLLGFREIKPDEAVRMINHDDALVIDIRQAEDFAKGHIVNALNYPFNALEERIGEFESHRDRVIIVCCANGRDSARAGVLLRNHGFQSIAKLSGGLTSWQGAGFPLNRS